MNELKVTTKQYVNKAALVAEIEKTEKYAKHRVNEAVDKYWQIHFDGWVTACRSIMSFLDALEVKEVEVPVSKDLEEAANDLEDYAYQVAYDLSRDWLKENATWDDVETAVKLGAQWQKQQLIDKACEWINLHIGELSDIYTRSAIRNEFLEDFRKAMEERL